MERVIVTSCIHMTPTPLWLDIVMLVGQVMLNRERALSVDVSFWEIISSHGLGRSKIVCHYPLLKLSTLQQEEIPCNYYG